MSRSHVCKEQIPSLDIWSICPPGSGIPRAAKEEAVHTIPVCPFSGAVLTKDGPFGSAEWGYHEKESAARL